MTRDSRVWPPNPVPPVVGPLRGVSIGCRGLARTSSSSVHSFMVDSPGRGGGKVIQSDEGSARDRTERRLAFHSTVSISITAPRY